MEYNVTGKRKQTTPLSILNRLLGVFQYNKDSGIMTPVKLQDLATVDASQCFLPLANVAGKDYVFDFAERSEPTEKKHTVLIFLRVDGRMLLRVEHKNFKDFTRLAKPVNHGYLTVSNHTVEKLKEHSVIGMLSLPTLSVLQPGKTEKHRPILKEALDYLHNVFPSVDDGIKLDKLQDLIIEEEEDKVEEEKEQEEEEPSQNLHVKSTMPQAGLCGAKRVRCQSNTMSAPCSSTVLFNSGEPVNPASAGGVSMVGPPDVPQLRFLMLEPAVLPLPMLVSNAPGSGSSGTAASAGGATAVSSGVSACGASSGADTSKSGKTQACLLMVPRMAHTLGGGSNINPDAELSGSAAVGISGDISNTNPAPQPVLTSGCSFRNYGGSEAGGSGGGSGGGSDSNGNKVAVQQEEEELQQQEMQQEEGVLQQQVQQEEKVLQQQHIVLTTVPTLVPTSPQAPTHSINLAPHQHGSGDSGGSRGNIGRGGAAPGVIPGDTLGISACRSWAPPQLGGGSTNLAPQQQGSMARMAGGDGRSSNTGSSGGGSGGNIGSREAGSGGSGGNTEGVGYFKSLILKELGASTEGQQVLEMSLQQIFEVEEATPSESADILKMMRAAPDMTLKQLIMCWPLPEEEEEEGVQD
ncbi:hypothetical protein Agub_g15608 [Astrephomene gubernaculifera]|uniref:Uncharacterized protein n=1 Tax=Astrephomene gubernaculifera TaxID=47775 RepID=A0AAD3E3B2_9CHLO|nr:hypothetical protein Agub_g15608 [Astrephomene gubernaculifera]